MRVQGIRQYVFESWSELKKVAWPTRQMVINLTIIVLIVGSLVGAYIAIIDLLLAGALRQVLG